VELAGIDDQFGRDSEAAEGLVHLLAAVEGDIEVLVAAHEEGRRFDAVGVVERVGELDVGLLGFPGREQFVVVLVDVLVDSVEDDGVADAGAAGCCFETRSAGDGVVGEDASVAPSADAETSGIGVAFAHGFIDGGEQVFNFMMSPVGEDGLLVDVSAARAAAVVHVEDGESAGGEELALEGEGVGILAVGSAVNS
jgi:hypothetical protein